MCKRVEHRFSCRAESVPAARHLVAGCLEAWGAKPDDPAACTADDTLLVVSELLGNAVKSRSSECDLTVIVHRDHVEVSVVDADPEPARVVAVGEDSPGGRGLAIVRAVSCSWGQRSYGRCKAVWCRLPVAAGSALGRGCRLAARA